MPGELEGALGLTREPSAARVLSLPPCCGDLCSVGLREQHLAVLWACEGEQTARVLRDTSGALPPLVPLRAERCKTHPTNRS